LARGTEREGRPERGRWPERDSQSESRREGEGDGDDDDVMFPSKA
jgi:hypothetical protein